MKGYMETFKKMLAESSRIALLSGAGVSTESGIPDFRSENGIFKAIKEFGHEPEVLLSHSFFVSHPDVFYEYYRKNLLVTDVLPNDAHKAFAELERQGKMTGIVTQNIDGLHSKSGSHKVYELHGTIYRNYCTECHKFYDAEYMKNSDGIPKCTCGGIIKPDVVLYEESLPEKAISGAIDAISNADMLIVGGTSLMVYPAAGFINYYRGNKLVLINKTPTAYDKYADLIIRDPIGEVMREAIDK